MIVVSWKLPKATVFGLFKHNAASSSPPELSLSVLSSRLDYFLMMMDFPQKIFLMNFVLIHPWRATSAFNQYFKNISKNLLVPALSSESKAALFPPNTYKSNINNHPQTRPPHHQARLLKQKLLVSGVASHGWSNINGTRCCW